MMDTDFIYRRVIPALRDIDRMHISDSWFNLFDVTEDINNFLTTYRLALLRHEDFACTGELSGQCLNKNRN